MMRNNCECRECRLIKKRQKREKMIVYGIVWPFLLCLAIFSYTVIRTAMAVETSVQQLPTWEPPEIPQCDEPLWDRVRDRCVSFTTDPDTHRRTRDD